MKSVINTETATLYLYKGTTRRKVPTYGPNVKFEKLPMAKFSAGKYSIYALTWKFTKGFYICRENDFTAVGNPKVGCAGGLELLGGVYHLSPDGEGGKDSIIYELKTGADGLYKIHTFEDKICVYSTTLAALL